MYVLSQTQQFITQIIGEKLMSPGHHQAIITYNHTGYM
jgi:hypothetical protein